MSLNASLASTKLILQPKQVFIFWIKYEKGDYMTIIYANVSADRNMNMIYVCSSLA